MSSRSAAPAALNLKDIAKQRIIEHMIYRVRQAGSHLHSEDNPYAKTSQQYCAMIVDVASLRILSSCCKVYDILEEGVTVVEDISKKRQPLPQLDAIYFISPDITSVELLCKDFMNEKQPQYRSAHVFFTLPLGADSAIMETIAKCSGLLPRLQSLVEFNLGFIAYERRVFHFDSPNMLTKLFPLSQPEILNQIVNELLSVCLTFGDKPNIRFHSNFFQLNEQLASLLHQRLSQLEIPGLTRGKTNLLIVDRSIDIAPLFLHEFTYQAYIYDLLDVPLCTCAQTYNSTETAEKIIPDDTIEYPVTTNEGKQELRLALLNEQDDVYVRYRHQHLMVALKKIPEEIKKFLSENAAAKLSKKKDMSNDEMQRAIRGLPEYQEMLSKFSVHHFITQRCFTEFNRQGINKVAPVEQDIATGVDSSGKEVSAKKVLAALGGIMSDPAIGTEEKLRLLLLYFSMIDGVKDDDRRKMMEAAQLPLEHSTSIYNYIKLGLDQGNIDPNAPTSSSSSSNHVHKLHRNKERLDFFINRAKTVDVSLSRFQPYLKDIMEKAIQNCLHRGKFPYVAEPDTKRRFVETETRTSVATVRARNRDWDFALSEDTHVDDILPIRIGDVQNSTINVLTLPPGEQVKLIVFVLGGITMSEMRSAYEVSRQFGADVFIGGSIIITPRKLLESLKRQKKNNHT